LLFTEDVVWLTQTVAEGLASLVHSATSWLPVIPACSSHCLLTVSV
jgi:hypothetical protein